MSTSPFQVGRAIAVLTCITSAMFIGCDRQGSQSGPVSAPQIRMSGGVNEWLSDGKMGLLVERFYEDPTGPRSSPVTYYRVRFTVKNLTRMPVELHKISVQFTTADLTDSVRQRLGGDAAAQVKPFENEINWARNLDNPESARVSRTVEPLGAYQVESSGHFYFGKKGPACGITFFRGGEIVAGPFHVALGDTIPK